MVDTGDMSTRVPAIAMTEAAEAAMLQHLNDSASYMARTLMMSTEQIKTNEAAIEEFNTDEKE